MFKPSVPWPLPVLAVIFQVVAGVALVAVTPVMAGVPPRPVFTRVKLPAVRPSIGSANTTCHVTVGLLFGLPLARLIETTVVSGRSTGVQVWVPIAGAAVQAGSALGAGSVVVTLLKLLPDTVLWFKMRVRISPGPNGSTVTRYLIVTVLPAGRVKAGTVTVSPDNAGAVGGASRGVICFEPLP